MSKRRRRLTEQQRLMVRNAARDGFVSYRYGSSRPVSLPRIFTGEKRRHMVSKAMDVLRDWRLSPFEHEGAARAGLRSGLCLKGHGWRQADHEAAELIAEGLHNMGAKRPSEIEGQRQYAVEREYCQWCAGPLDSEDTGNHRRFCCTECARGAREHNAMLYKIVSNITRAAAAYVAEKSTQPERPCQWCGKNYKPASLLRNTKTETCSPECNRAYVGSLKGRKICPQCQSPFLPSWVNDKFCSVDCQQTHRNDARRAETAERHVPTPCEYCGEQFAPKKAGTRFCGHRCRWKAGQARRQDANGERPCMECGVVFKPVRPEAKCCSPSCASSFRARVAPKPKESAFVCEEVEPVPFLEAAE